MVEDERLKGVFMSFQEESAEDPVIEVTVVPPVPNEDAPLPATNWDGHPDEELTEPVEKESPEVVVPEVCTRLLGCHIYSGLLDTRNQLRPSLRRLFLVRLDRLSRSRRKLDPQSKVGPRRRFMNGACTETLLGEEISPSAEDIPSTTEAVEPEQTEQVVEPELVEEVQVTELENPEETLLVEESPAPKLVPEPSNVVKEVLVEAEPVVATPLTFVVPEHVMEPVVTEEALAVDPVEVVTPNVVAEETLAVDELEVPTPGLREKIEEATSVVAAPVEGSEPSPEVTEQEVPVSVVSESTVEPAAEGGPASDPLGPDVPSSEPALGEVPPVESEFVGEPQESEAAEPPAPPEAKPSVDEVESGEIPPAIPDPAEAAQDIPALDVPQEETEQAENSWTPSYSVSSQGGDLDTAPPADEEAVESTPAPEPPVEESAAESAPAPEIVTPAEVRASNVPPS